MSGRRGARASRLVSANSYKSAKKGKDPLALISPDFQASVSRALGEGEGKHQDRHWRDGVDPNEVLAAIERHIACIKRGEVCDPKTGIEHAAYAAAGLQIMHETEQIYGWDELIWT